MNLNELIILGAGVTGLAAGIKTGAPIYEANPYPGGICHSYRKNGYYFEIGGGRWIFGNDKPTLKFIHSLSPLKYYKKNSAVFLPQKNLYIPYPLQTHLSLLPSKIAKKAMEEINKKNGSKTLDSSATLADWLKFNFGSTLCNFFFFPFHHLYTAGLYTKIMPQDQFKTPTSPKTKDYNKTFAYPKEGLYNLIQKMAKKCEINYNKKVIHIDINERKIFFADGTKLKYKKIISTLPLNKMVKLTKISLKEPSPPYTSVVVVNIGAKKGKRCPHYHWLYLPKNNAGAYRVGFYSNVDEVFLPKKSRKNKDRVAIYVEKAYLGGKKPTNEAIKRLINTVLQELREWDFISKPEVVQTSWIETAYTWLFPNSKWREKALTILKENNIYQIGRFGRWRFQGILESIKEGLTFSLTALTLPK